MHVVMERAKPRRIWQSMGFRLYYLARRRVSSPALLRLFLNVSWLFRRFAWEEAWRLYGVDRSFEILRPHTREAIAEALSAGDTVVDFGCGTGAASAFAAPAAASVLAIDHDPGAVAMTGERCATFENVTVVQGDWGEVFADRPSMDLGLLLHTLEHFDEPERALGELRQWCKRLVIEVPDFSSDPLNHARAELGTAFENDADHVTEFDRDWLQSVLSRAGWTVERLEPVNGVLVAVASAAEQRD